MASPPQIFSHTRRIARAVRHQRLARCDPAAQFLPADAAEDIAEGLAFMQVVPGPVLIHGDGSGLLGEALATRGFVPHARGPANLDEEQPLPGGFALIVSLFALDSVNDLPGALLHIRRALPEGGMFLGCLTGSGSLPALRRILLAGDSERPAARVHPQIDNRAASALMQRAGFTRQVVDSRSLTVRCSTLSRLVAYLRAQGQTNVLADPPPALTGTGLALADAAFAALAGADAR